MNIVIIGHSSGIGAALRTKLAATHQVYGTYCTHEVPSSASVHSVALDVCAEQPDFSFLPDIIDGLVYCPGAIQLKPFSRLKEDDFIQDYRIQVGGAIKVIQACLPKLKQSAYAPGIVLFSTVAVNLGFNFHSLVSSSKGAIEGLTKALAAEFAPKIRVNCIAPSITQTPLAASLLSTPEKIEANAQRHPLKRIGSAEDIASMAFFLLGEESAWISGQVFHVDGGMSSIKL